MTKLLAALTLVVSAAGGCCGYKARARTPALDFFERYVIVDIGKPPECALPKRRTESGRAVPSGRAIPVWVRAVAATDVRKPIAGATIRLSVVTSFGGPVADAVITPSVVQTGMDGFGIQAIELRIGSPLQHYRVKAEFADKEATGITYSPFLIPTSSSMTTSPSAGCSSQ